MISFHKDCHNQVYSMKNEVFDAGILISSSSSNYCELCNKYLNYNDIYHANGEYMLTTSIDQWAESMKNIKGFKREIKGMPI